MSPSDKRKVAKEAPTTPREEDGDDDTSDGEDGREEDNGEADEVGDGKGDELKIPFSMAIAMALVGDKGVSPLTGGELDKE
jgi:hypothetical protein